MTIAHLLKRAGFDEDVEEVIGREGKIGVTTDLASDRRGGATQAGISQAYFGKNPDGSWKRSKAQIAAMTPGEIKAVYRDIYKVPDKFTDPRVRKVMFDMTTNAGPTANGILQRSVNGLLPVDKRLKVDNIAGSGTLAAAKGVDQGRLAGKLLDGYSAHHTQLIQNRPDLYAENADGWRNRVNGLRTAVGSIKPVLVKGTPQQQPVLVKGQLQTPSKPAPTITQPGGPIMSMPMLSAPATQVMTKAAFVSSLFRVTIAKNASDEKPTNPVADKKRSPEALLTGRQAGIGELIKQAAEMKRKTKLTESHSDHCPHCDFEFREKCYPVVKDKGERVSSIDKVYTTGEYDEHCPECDGVLDQKERSDEEIDGDAWLTFPDAKEQAIARRDAQRRRKAEREGQEKSAMMKQVAAQSGKVKPENFKNLWELLSKTRNLDQTPTTEQSSFYVEKLLHMLPKRAPAPGPTSIDRYVARVEAQKANGWAKKASIASLLRQARKATHKHPTEAQRATGNYRHGKVTIHGLRISIENPKGSIRRGKDKNGKPWANKLAGDYGFFTGSKAIDGDAIDVFIGGDLDSELVTVIDQYFDGKFDESKFVICSATQAKAEKIYLGSYQKGWKLGDVSTTTVQQLKEWLKDGDHKKPFKGQLVKAAAKWITRAVDIVKKRPEFWDTLEGIAPNLKNVPSGLTEAPRNPSAIRDAFRDITRPIRPPASPRAVSLDRFSPVTEGGRIPSVAMPSYQPPMRSAIEEASMRRTWDKATAGHLPVVNNSAADPSKRGWRSVLPEEYDGNQNYGDMFVSSRPESAAFYHPLATQIKPNMVTNKWPAFDSKGMALPPNLDDPSQAIWTRHLGIGPGNPEYRARYFEGGHISEAKAPPTDRNGGGNSFYESPMHVAENKALTPRWISYAGPAGQGVVPMRGVPRGKKLDRVAQQQADFWSMPLAGQGPLSTLWKSAARWPKQARVEGYTDDLQTPNLYEKAASVASLFRAAMSARSVASMASSNGIGRRSFLNKVWRKTTPHAMPDHPIAQSLTKAVAAATGANVIDVTNDASSALSKLKLPATPGLRPAGDINAAFTDAGDLAARTMVAPMAPVALPRASTLAVLPGTYSRRAFLKRVGTAAALDSGVAPMVGRFGAGLADMAGAVGKLY